jgi:hypothetical protein
MTESTTHCEHHELHRLNERYAIAALLFETNREDHGRTRLDGCPTQASTTFQEPLFSILGPEIYGLEQR